MSSDLRFLSILLALFIYLIICLWCVGSHISHYAHSGVRGKLQKLVYPFHYAYSGDQIRSSGLAGSPSAGWAILPFLPSDCFLFSRWGNSDHNVNTQTKATINQVCPDFTQESPMKESEVKPPLSGLPVFFPVRGHPCLPLYFHLMAGTSAYWESSACQHHLGTNMYLSLVLRDIVVAKWSG